MPSQGLAEGLCGEIVGDSNGTQIGSQICLAASGSAHTIDTDRALIGLQVVYHSEAPGGHSTMIYTMEPHQALSASASLLRSYVESEFARDVAVDEGIQISLEILQSYMSVVPATDDWSSQ